MNKAKGSDAHKELFWRKAIARWVESGLGQGAFCEREKLNQNTFSSWKRIISERDQAKAAAGESPTIPFVPVIVANDTTRPGPQVSKPIAEIDLKSHVVRIFNGATIDTLRVLLQAIRE